MTLLSGAVHPKGLLLAGGAHPAAPVISEDLGRVGGDGTGYDGQQVYVLARFFPHLDEAAPHLDDPRYRALRILQPAMASLAPHGVPTVLALAALGLFGCALGAGAVADLCARHGRSPAAGAVAGAALFLPVLITTVEALAFGLALVAVAFVDRGRWLGASVLFVLAALTRETTVVVALMAALGVLPAIRWRAAAVVGAPAAALLSWHLVLGRVLGGQISSRTDPLAIIGAPALEVALGVAILVGGAATAWHWRDVATVWPVALAFGLWVFAYTVDTLHWLALLRVSAPVLALGAAAAWTTGVTARQRPSRIGARGVSA